MFHRHLSILAVVLTLACDPADAATVEVSVVDSGGAPAANAVVSLDSQTSTILMPPHTPEKSVIDQRHETFLPLVVIVRRGGSVVFTNNDMTMHQVYSFSPIKQFQFEIDQGQVSKPVVFPMSGVAAIGCNIHDAMVAYVFVADAPFAAVSDAHGRAEFRNVPDGTYRATVWHPQMRIGRQPPPTVLTVAGASAKLALSVPLTAQSGMSRMHKSDY